MERKLYSKEEYRARRKERREKQRATNLQRAETMHEKRLAAENENANVISGLTNSIFIGCSGWYYWKWKALFYPSNLPQKEWFQYYQRCFNTVELNSPFYTWPTISTIKSWLRQAKKKDFSYTIKVAELITHIKKFNGTKTLVKDFNYIGTLLSDRMGCFLYQLPPSFHFTKTRLKNILSQLNNSFRNVVEFRHPSWWCEEVYKGFEKNRIIFCSVSAPNLPDTLIKTTEDIYIRFHGTTKWYKHNYTNSELIIWADKIRAANSKHAWIYFNNDNDAYAPKNALTLKKLIKNK